MKATAAEWYLMSAEQGHIVSQSRLGWLYKVGDGLAQNYALAVGRCRWTVSKPVLKAPMVYVLKATI